MTKIKHVRTADCVVAGYRVHKSAADAIGSLLLGLYVDEAAPPSHWMDRTGGLAPVGVIGAFPMARRRELFSELQALVVDVTEHPWSRAAELARAPEGGSRWNPNKDLSFVPLRPERVVEVRYDYLEGARFRHPPQFVRWRPRPRLLRLRPAGAADALRCRRRPRRPAHPLDRGDPMNTSSRSPSHGQRGRTQPSPPGNTHPSW
jgi:ATP-dependent DNA ligase